MRRTAELHQRLIAQEWPKRKATICSLCGRELQATRRGRRRVRDPRTGTLKCGYYYCVPFHSCERGEALRKLNEEMAKPFRRMIEAAAKPNLYPVPCPDCRDKPLARAKCRRCGGKGTIRVTVPEE